MYFDLQSDGDHNTKSRVLPTILLITFQHITSWIDATLTKSSVQCFVLNKYCDNKNIYYYVDYCHF